MSGGFGRVQFGFLGWRGDEFISEAFVMVREVNRKDDSEKEAAPF